MKVIIIDNWAYRINRANILEAVESVNGVSGRVTCFENWRMASPDEQGMTGGELDTIRQTLARLAQLFQDGRTPPPKSTRIQKEVLDPAAAQ